MVEIKSTSNGFIVKGINNAQYPYDGELTFPFNSVVIVTEEGSDMVLFKSASNFDNLFSGLIGDITINGEKMTKDNIGNKFASIASSSGGGGGGTAPALRYEIVVNLPSTGESNVIYLVRKSDGGTDKDVFDEYIYVDGDFERIGSITGSVDVNVEGRLRIFIEAESEYDTNYFQFIDPSTGERTTDVKIGDIIISDRKGTDLHNIITKINYGNLYQYNTHKVINVYESKDFGVNTVYSFTLVPVQIIEAAFTTGESVLLFPSNSYYIKMYEDGRVRSDNVKSMGYYVDEYGNITLEGNKLIGGITSEMAKQLGGFAAVTNHLNINEYVRKNSCLPNQLILQNHKVVFDEDKRMNDRPFSVNDTITVQLDGVHDQYNSHFYDSNGNPYSFDKYYFEIEGVKDGIVATWDGDINYPVTLTKNGDYWSLTFPNVSSLIDPNDRQLANSGLAYYYYSTRSNYIAIDFNEDRTNIVNLIYNAYGEILNTKFVAYVKKSEDDRFNDRAEILNRWMRYDGEDAGQIKVKYLHVENDEGAVNVMTNIGCNNFESWNVTTLRSDGGQGGGGGMTDEEKEELKNLRADMENALGDIAALGYDKADKTELENYATKQEVNQNYVQKSGEYVKNVTSNGGAINFEKGNGTPDVVNLKTIGGQSIIGMDDIPLPKYWQGTKDAYDALGTYDAKTVYYILED